MKSVYKIGISIILIIAAIAVVYYLGLAHYLSLESIKTNAAYLKEQTALHAIWAVIIFTGVSAGLIALTLPITGPMAVVAGFLFNFWLAILYSMIAVMIGTAISFLIVRFAMGQVMRNSYGDQLGSFKEKLQSYGYSYLITLQLLTVVPYFIINTLAALAEVPFHIFMWTTFIGSLPVIAIYAFAGRQLYMIRSWQDILSFNMLALLLMLALLAMLPMIVRRFKKT